MLLLVPLLLSLSAAPTAQEPPPAPTPEAVEAALAALKTAFDAKDHRERIGAILEHGWIDEERVIAYVSRGLSDRDAEVRIVAVEALGGMHSDRSLEALTRYFERRHNKTRRDPELWPRLFRAVGRRGDPRAIPTLLQSVREQMSRATIRARLFALANIRSKDSVAGVLEVLERLEERHREASMEDARTALLVLTGERIAGDEQALRDWWAARPPEYTLPAEAPRLEGPAWEAWREFWELPEREPAPDAGDGDSRGAADEPPPNGQSGR